MPVTCVIGLQWGDEAKGKIVNLLTEQHDIVVRYQGGSNAGHTVVRQGQTYKLSLVPSGIFRPEVQCVIASGVVVNPASLVAEIDGLAGRGIAIGQNLMLSNRAHVIFPWHIEEDRLAEQQCGGEAIGTTMRGIGPCYRDKFGRGLAVRFGDMYRPDFRADRADRGREESDFRRPWRRRRRETRPAGNLRPVPCLCGAAGAARGRHDGLFARRRRGRQAIAVRGRPGALLDIDHGTFPFVTSSNSSGVGASAGSGVPGRYVTKVLGVVKAYATRVGGGPFPTEQDNAAGEHIRRRGQRIWHGDATAAALRVVRRRGRPLHGPPQRRGRAGRHVVGRSGRVAGVENLHGLRTGRPADHGFSRPRGRPAAGRARV